MHTFKAVCLLAAALLLACAQSPVRDESRSLDERLAGLGYRQGEPVDSILQYDIDGWEYLDPHHIVLGHRPGRAYLVELSSPCRNLAFGSPLGYSTTVGSLTKLDKIITTDVGGFPEHCLIRDIHRLERLEKATDGRS